MLETMTIGVAIAAAWLMIYTLFNKHINGKFMTWWTITIIPCGIVIAVALKMLEVI